MSAKSIRIHQEVAELLEAHCPRYMSLSQFCNFVVDQQLQRMSAGLDKNSLSPLTIPPYPTNTIQRNRIEKEGEGVENDERQRGVLVGEEGERERIRFEEVNRPLEAPQKSTSGHLDRRESAADPQQISRNHKPAADHPWRTDDLHIGHNVIPDKLRDFDQQIRDFWKVKKGSKNRTAWNRQMTQLIAMLDKYGPRVVGEQLDEGALKGTWQAITVKQYEQWGKPKNNGFEPMQNHPAQKVFKASDLGPEWERNLPPSATGGKGVLDPGAF